MPRPEKNAAEVARHDDRHLAHAAVKERREHRAPGRPLGFAVVARAHLGGRPGLPGDEGPAVVGRLRVLGADALEKVLCLLGRGDARKGRDEARAPDDVLHTVDFARRQIGYEIAFTHASVSVLRFR